MGETMVAVRADLLSGLVGMACATFKMDLWRTQRMYLLTTLWPFPGLGKLRAKLSDKTVQILTTIEVLEAAKRQIAEARQQHG